MGVLTTNLVIALAALSSVLQLRACVAADKNTEFLFNDFNRHQKSWSFDNFLRDADNFLYQNYTRELVRKTTKSRALGYEFYNRWQTIVESAAPSDVDTTCFTHIAALVAGLAKNELASYKYFDSWGKIPTGILKGHLSELGNFDECVALQKSLIDKTVINGKYCFAKMPIGKLVGLADLGVYINIGVCMPASCSAKQFDIFYKILIKNVLSIDLGNVDVVSEASCSVAAKEPFDAWDCVAIVVLSILIAAMLFSSLYEYFIKTAGKQPNAILCTFSIPSNLSQLLHVQPNARNPNIIHCLNGIRCLSTIWVVFGHTFSLTVILPNINALDVLPWSRTAISMLMQYAIFSVDTFFFISGLLVAFLGLRELERNNGKLNVPMMYVHRILRLTPMLALAILVYATMYRHLASGPIWPIAKNFNDVCRETWWATLLYVQNYVNVDEMCVGHSWYLAVDMQLYIISPIFLIVVWRYKRKGVAFVCLIALLFGACSFSSIMVNDYVYHLKGVYQIEIEAMRKTYFATHTRTAGWFVGFLFGYIMHLTRSRRVKLSKIFVFLCWACSFGLFATVLFSFYSKAYNRSDVTTLEEAFYWTLSRYAWPLALSWLVFACVNGYAGPINGFLSNPIWQPLTRASFCIYIWHIIFVELHVGRQKTDTYFSNYDITLRFWGDFGWTLILSVFMYIAFEAPLLNLEKILLPKGAKPKLIPATTQQQDGAKTTTGTSTNIKEIPAET